MVAIKERQYVKPNSNVAYGSASDKNTTAAVGTINQLNNSDLVLLI